MNRRHLLILGAGTFVPILEVVAQATASPRRIGLLTVEDIFSVQRDSIVAALAHRGWIDGKNLYLVARSGGGDRKRLRQAAEELVRLEVELIVGIGTVACQEAKAVTSRIPIVMYGAGEPVATGLVPSLARPGGNVTGVSIVTGDQATKRIDVLRDLLPVGSIIGFLTHPANPAFAIAREAEEKTCRTLGFVPIHADVAKGEELVPAVTEIARRKARVLVVSSDPFFAAPVHLALVRETARRVGLPIVSAGTAQADGVLLSYSIDWNELNNQVASFVDRILKGAKPAVLPVEQPSRFLLSINLRTAKAAGITVPESLLLRADSVFR